MKKLLFILLLFISVTAMSQNKKGTIQVGIGGLPIIYFDNSVPTGYSLRANVGYFVSDRLAVGVLPFAGKVDQISSLGAAIYSRYYLTDSKLSFFLEGSVGLGTVNYERDSNFDGTMSSVSFGPGFGYRLNPKFTIEFLAQYARLKNESFPESTLLGNTFMPTFTIQYSLFKQR